MVTSGSVEPSPERVNARTALRPIYLEPGSRRYLVTMTERAQHIDFDGLMHMLTVTGFVALTTWVATSTVGVISGYVAVSAPATLRFLLAVLILVFARRTYWELREWRWSKMSPDERSGFTNPMWERSRGSARDGSAAPVVGPPAEADGTATVTSSQHPRA